MFRTEFALHVRYNKGLARFSREEQLPFPPFIGLDVLDDVLGQFKLRDVAWASNCQMFLCQAEAEMDHLALGAVKRHLREAGWVEDREARQPDPRKPNGSGPSPDEDR